jgi:hypothetical protein
MYKQFVLYTNRENWNLSDDVCTQNGAKIQYYFSEKVDVRQRA